MRPDLFDCAKLLFETKVGYVAGLYFFIGTLNSKYYDQLAVSFHRYP